MADREQITQPSLGSNELGTETNDTHLESGVSAGTDTQLHLAAKSHKKSKANKRIVRMTKMKRTGLVNMRFHVQKTPMNKFLHQSKRQAKSSAFF